MGDHAGGAAGLGVARAAREADAAVSAGAETGCRSGLIDEWLEADREAPCKQHHTAKRVWSRLVDEHGAAVAETTVGDYLRQRKRAMVWPVGEVFVPQVHAPGRALVRLGSLRRCGASSEA